MARYEFWGEKQREADEPALVARGGADLAGELNRAIQSLPENMMKEPGALSVQETVTVPETVADVHVGSLFLDADGSLYLRKPDSLGKHQAEKVEFPSDKAKERVSGMVCIRDTFTRLRRARLMTAPHQTRSTICTTG